MSEDREIFVRVENHDSKTEVFIIKRASFENLKEFYKQVTPKLFDSFVFDTDNDVNVSKSSYIMERRSKRENGYTNLSTRSDYDDLLRSLNVKDQVKIRILLNKSKTDQSVSEKLDAILKSLNEIEDSQKPQMNQFPVFVPTAPSHHTFQPPPPPGYFLPHPHHAKHEEFINENFARHEQARSRHEQARAKHEDIDTHKQHYHHHHVRHSKKEKHRKKVLLQDQLNISGIIHKFIICDQCDNDAYIEGTRYKCLNCSDYDLCEKCYNDKKFNDTHTEDHQMIAISPASNIDDIKGQCIREDIIDGMDSLVDISFDDAEHRAEIVSLLKEFNTLEKIRQLKASFESSNADEAQFKEIPTTDYITVIFEIVRAEKISLKFKLINESNTTIQSDNKLKFNYKDNELSINLGPNPIIPGGTRKGTQFLSEDLSEQIASDVNPFILANIISESRSIFTGETIVDSFHFNQVKLTKSDNKSENDQADILINHESDDTFDENDDETLANSEALLENADLAEFNDDEDQLSITDDLEDYHILSTDDCLTE